MVWQDPKMFRHFSVVITLCTTSTCMSQGLKSLSYWHHLEMTPSSHKVKLRSVTTLAARPCRAAQKLVHPMNWILSEDISDTTNWKLGYNTIKETLPPFLSIQRSQLPKHNSHEQAESSCKPMTNLNCKGTGTFSKRVTSPSMAPQKSGNSSAISTLSSHQYASEMEVNGPQIDLGVFLITEHRLPAFVLWGSQLVSGSACAQSANYQLPRQRGTW